jgi:spore germination protein YaaH
MFKRTTLFAFLCVALCSPAFAFRNAAWIPPWDANALTSIQMNAGSLQESNPVWYSMNADGSIAKNWNAENATWRAAMTGTTLIPTIQNVVNHSFDANVVAALLATTASRDAHATAITTLVTSNGFDGIDVDYERVPYASRANFSAFVQTVAQKLHAAGKTLSVTVYAKTSDKPNWNGAGAEDYVAIGAAADSVKIMAYDYSNDGTAAGPITPLDWLDQVAAYAESAITPQKVMIGLPWYGYDWSASGVTTATFSSATLTAQTNSAAISRDASGEPTYSYNGHKVFFEDATSYAKKVDLLRQKHAAIGGIAHWAAGVEDPALWNAMRDNAKAIPSTTPHPPVARKRVVGH